MTVSRPVNSICADEGPGNCSPGVFERLWRAIPRGLFRQGGHRSRGAPELKAIPMADHNHFKTDILILPFKSLAGGSR